VVAPFQRLLSGAAPKEGAARDARLQQAEQLVVRERVEDDDAGRRIRARARPQRVGEAAEWRRRAPRQPPTEQPAQQARPPVQAARACILPARCLTYGMRSLIGIRMQLASKRSDACAVGSHACALSREQSWRTQGCQKCHGRW